MSDVPLLDPYANSDLADEVTTQDPHILNLYKAYDVSFPYPLEKRVETATRLFKVEDATDLICVAAAEIILGRKLNLRESSKNHPLLHAIIFDRNMPVEDKIRELVEMRKLEVAKQEARNERALSNHKATDSFSKN